ncbi:MAG: 3-deoxy-manno-octulosonate cytidylyltransferase [Candidatus Neomarinimicrobiota bacterium]|jgi:3-deoxy-manno-octulosonate cytidylyltransferase (CMP-KDO synthetase)|nr:3-deoxy-manno-octulosonate cytidylyltransferase [Candidatus Neomarinimicrobiota bacterium]
MKAIGVIPARLYSSRFPKKILHLIDGKPMVVHVYEQAQKAKSLDYVIVAIDTEETAKALKPFKVNTVMTSENHVSGTDRIQETVADLDADVVVNIQGDEPKIDPALIDKLVAQFEDESIQLATAAGKDMDAKKLTDVNTVKVLLDGDGFAVNFRRELVATEAGGYYHHMGIYAYRKATLEKFTALAPSKNELALKLEQYRALDNGIPIKVILADKVNKGIDTMDDLKEFDRI